MNATYVRRGGQITRRRDVNFKDFSRKRLSIIIGICLVLFISNPGNGNLFSSARSKINLGSYKFEFLGYEINISSTSRPNHQRSTYHNSYQERHSYLNDGTTNYHLFTLSKDSNGVDIGLLFTQLPLCSYHWRSPNLCSWISNNLCHGKFMFNPREKSFTVYRLLQILKIASFMLQKCYIYNAPLFPKIDFDYLSRYPFSLISSTFHEVDSVRDLVSLNTFLYPALTLFERITTLRASIENNTMFQYYGVTFTLVLILLIGGISNFLSSCLLSDRVGGMKGSLASCLGFITAIKPEAIVLEWFDVRLTAGEMLFSTFAVTFGSTLLGFTAITAGEWETGNIFAWAFGGLLGYALGEYQKDKLHPWLIRLFS